MKHSISLVGIINIWKRFQLFFHFCFVIFIIIDGASKKIYLIEYLFYNIKQKKIYLILIYDSIYLYIYSFNLIYNVN